MDNNVHIQITSRYLEYHEKSISGEKRAEIEKHLDACHHCSVYYRVMGEALGVANRVGNREIEPDPYLPARVKALMESSSRKNRPSLVPSFIRVGAAAGAFCVAIAIGVVLGKGIAVEKKTPYSSSMATTYIDAFRQYGIGDHMEYTFNTAEVKQ